VKWAEGRPLPTPQWDPPPPPLNNFPSVEEYEDFATKVELVVQQFIKAHNYDTLSNFIRFYGDFKRSDGWEVDEFFRRYPVSHQEGEYTCVGQGRGLIEQLTHLESHFPGISKATFLVSSEEIIDDLLGYVAEGVESERTEKEHVLVCIRINVNSRRGCLLLDGGYHVARVITVMEDQMYPHTGWFTQHDNKYGKLEYHYSFLDCDKDFVLWRVRDTKVCKVKENNSLIYIGKKYLSHYDVTERRNLVYSFRSWLARNTKGQLLAGVYFPIKNSPLTNFTLLYTDRQLAQSRVNIPLSSFLPNKVLKLEELGVVEMCGEQLGVGGRGLTNILRELSVILTDSHFISQLLDINEEINNMSL